MDLIGERINLQGWDKFKGGLDVKGTTTGTQSYYATFRQSEVMFHVCSLLPLRSYDPSQIERKKRLGGDKVLVLFTELEEPVLPELNVHLRPCKLTINFVLYCGCLPLTS